MRGENGEGQDGSKSLNPSHLAPWSGAKISPLPCLTTFAGRGNPVRGEAGRGGTKLLSLLRRTRRGFVRLWADSINQYVTTVLNFVKILITIYKTNTIQ